MYFIVKLLIFYFTLSCLYSYPSNLRDIEIDLDIISEDLNSIVDTSKIQNLEISFKINQRNRQKSHHGKNHNLARILCSEREVNLVIEANQNEVVPTIYNGMQKLGFLFPHPRIQISPSRDQVLRKCGETIYWSPSLTYRGFHYHTMHPNEWVHAFLLGKTEIAYDSIRWLARNMQNVMEVNLLRSIDQKTIFSRLKQPFAFAKKFGIHAGVNASIALQQQKAYRFIKPRRLLLRLGTKRILIKELKKLLKHVDISFLSLDAGTSEFTKTNYQKSIDWMEIAGEVCEELGVQLFMNVHVSSNQNHKKFGNFNFLPQYNSSRVGIKPHTVMFYGLTDELAPIYGNKNFKHILNFALTEKNNRPTWYYPETSYFIGLDIDVPLLLTDYLIARSADMKKINEVGIEGQINFTSGQELGYWLFDWTVALLSNREYNFDPYIGLRLLNEDLEVWKKII